MPVIVPTNKSKHSQIKGGKACSLVLLKKAWYLVPRIELIDNKAEIAYDEVETWFPDRWEKKNSKSNFIKKSEVTYKMSIPEAKLIEYAFENGYIKEEPEND